MGGYMIIRVVRLDFFGTVPITTNFFGTVPITTKSKVE